MNFSAGHLCQNVHLLIEWLQSILQLFSFFFFFHSLSLPIAVFASVILVHCFTKGHNLSNHYKLY